MTLLQGPDSLTSETVIGQTIRQLWDNLPQILLAGLIFNFLCLPALVLALLGFWIPAIIIAVFVVGPGWTALLAQESDILRYKVFSLKNMSHALVQYWFYSVKLSLMALVPIVALFFTLPTFTQSEVPHLVWVGLGADIFGLLLLSILFLYAFPLLVLYEVNVRGAVQTGFMLASRHLINTFGLLSLGVCLFLGAFYVSSAILFFLPALAGAFIINNCRLVVRLEGIHENPSPPAHL